VASSHPHNRKFGGAVADELRDSFADLVARAADIRGYL
jgi:hypothetical protein